MNSVLFKRDLLLLLIFSACSLLFGQKTEKSSLPKEEAVKRVLITGTIKGTVKSEKGEPLPGAFITVEGTTQGAKADNNGYYLITEVKAGTYNLKCQLSGFQPAQKKGVQVRAGMMTSADFKMISSEIKLKDTAIKLPAETAKEPTATVPKNPPEQPRTDKAPPVKNQPAVPPATIPKPEARAEVKGKVDPVPPVTTTKKFDSEIPPPPPPPPASKAERVEEEAADFYEVKEPSVKVKVPPPVSKRMPTGLKAGFADDNKQFNYFLDFLKKYEDKVPHLKIPIGERITIKIRDRNDKPVCDAQIKIFSRDTLLASGLTHADGSFLFFPAEYAARHSAYHAKIDYQQQNYSLKFSRQDKRQQEIKLPVARQNYQQVPLDILFIFDTTGSMGEEIERLKNTIELINLNISELPGKPLVRFGMVLYRDKRDSYVTKVVPFTADLPAFMQELQKVQADGGGDRPEDLNSALEAAMNQIEWNPAGVKMAFVITDAPAHLDYNQPYAYDQQVKNAVKKGIKIFTIGTGGLDIKGEYVLRQISQYTSGRYIFLTYGEKGESEGGHTGGVSHHTGDNFQTDKLEAVILKFTREELEYFRDNDLLLAEDYFQATKTDSQASEATLDELFSKAVGQLLDFSAILLPAKMNTAILPLQPAGLSEKTVPEYLTERLNKAVLANKQFKLIERGNLKSVVEELSLQQTGLTSEDSLTKAGQLLGADYLITGKLFVKNGIYELYLRLIRVESGEILAVTKARIDEQLVK